MAPREVTKEVDPMEELVRNMVFDSARSIGLPYTDPLVTEAVCVALMALSEGYEFDTAIESARHTLQKVSLKVA